MHRKKLISLTLIIIIISAWFFINEPIKHQNKEPIEKHPSLEEQVPPTEKITTYTGDAESRLIQRFTEVGLVYPPKSVTFLAIKNTAMLELWVNNADEKHYVASYPIKAQSGVVGPKLREGDRQVPEGVYRITWLHPNSSYHRSMKINYPNKFDRQHAENEGRSEPGTNIFIHGRAVSIGCLAMGDPAIEELYKLVEDIGTQDSNIIIAPTDPRKSRLQRLSTIPWTNELYSTIEAEFRKYNKPK